MKPVPIAVGLLLLLCLMVPDSSLAGRNSKASVYFESGRTISESVLEITVWASNVRALKGYDIEIATVDPGIVILNQVEESDFLRSLGGQTFFMPRAFSGSRLWVANAVEGSGALYTPSGRGRLFTFRIRKVDNQVKKINVSKALSFVSVVFADSDLNKDKIK
jgi:hypothetical protein